MLRFSLFHCEGLVLCKMPVNENEKKLAKNFGSGYHIIIGDKENSLFT